TRVPTPGLWILSASFGRADAPAPAGAEGRDLAARLEGADDRAAGSRQPLVRGEACGQVLLGRHAPAAGDRAGDRRRSQARHRGRAHGGPRSRRAAALLPPAHRAGRAADGALEHAHRRGRGRALSAVRGDPRRSPRRAHHAGCRARRTPAPHLRGCGLPRRHARAARHARGDADAARRGPPPRAALRARGDAAARFRGGAAVARGRLPGAHAPRRAARRGADRRHRAPARPPHAGDARSAPVSGTRLWEIFQQEIQFHARRPLLWVQLLILGFLTYSISIGHASVSSGDARVGGHKAFINSEFAISQLLIFLCALIYVFFASVAAGMSMIRDDEAKVGELLHSTPLKPGEYVWGKFLAVFTMFVATLAVHLGLMMLFNHVLPHGENADYVGPFHLASYLRPALVFALPSLMLFCGACFGIGGLTRKPVLVFFLPIAVLMVGVFFLWEWSPVWLSWGWNRALQFVDLTGLRWLKEVWLDVDKGVEWYNVHPVGLDALVIVQRLLCVVLGLASVWLLRQRFAATLRGASAARGRSAADVPSAIPAGARRDGRKPAAAPQPAAAGAVATLATLDMRSGVPGFLNGVLEVARAELHGFLRHP